LKAGPDEGEKMKNEDGIASAGATAALYFPLTLPAPRLLFLLRHRNSNRNFTSAPRFPNSFRSPRRDMFLFRMYSIRNTCSG
jgi:hypothetical protein